MPTQDMSMWSNALAQPPNALDTMNKLAQTQSAQTQVDSQRLENAQKHLQFMVSHISPLISLGDKVSVGDVTRAANDAVERSGGTVSQQEANQWAQNIITHPQGIAQALKMAQSTALDGMSRIAVMRGIGTETQTGGGTQYGTRDPYTNAYTPQATGGYVPNTTTPAEKMSPRDIFVNGQKGTIPAGTMFDDYGNPKGSASKPAIAAGTKAGAQPQGEQPTPAPAAPAPPPAPSGFVPTDAPLGQREGAAASGQISGGEFGNDLVHAANITQRTFPLMQAIPALEKLGQKGTGPGTEGYNQIRSFLGTYGMTDAKAIDNTKLYDEAKKYMTDYVNRNGNTGTNDKLAAAFAGNPSVNISNAAAVDVAKSAVALDRMKAAQARAFAATGLPESQYSRWASQWNSKQDPRAYGADLMGPVKLRQLVDKMGDAERSRFVNSLEAAHTLQLSSPKGQ